MRLPLLSPDQLTDAQRRLYDNLLGGKRAGAGLAAPDGSLRGPFNALLYSPEIGDRVQKVGEALRFESALPQNLLEIAVCCVGREWSAEFEFWAHARLAKAAGVADEVIDAIRNRRPPPFTDPAEATVHRFAAELVGEGKVSDEAYRAAAELLGEAQTVELVLLIGYYSLVSCILNTFEIPLPEGVAPLPQ